MEEVLLGKEEGLRIAISILSGKKTNKDYGSASLRDTELILKNILETIEMEKELLARPEPKLELPSKKERVLNPSQRKNLEIAEKFVKKLTGKTIRDLEC